MDWYHHTPHMSYYQKKSYNYLNRSNRSVIPPPNQEVITDFEQLKRWLCGKFDEHQAFVEKHLDECLADLYLDLVGDEEDLSEAIEDCPSTEENLSESEDEEEDMEEDEPPAKVSRQKLRRSSTIKQESKN